MTEENKTKPENTAPEKKEESKKETKPRKGVRERPDSKEPEVVWVPKTEVGRKVQNKEITDLSVVLAEGQRIFEAELVESLLPDAKTELLFIGQAKGKFGGGQKRAFKQTQKKTPIGYEKE